MLNIVMYSQQTPDAGPVLRDDGPALDQQWFVVSCLLGNRYVFPPYKIYMNLMTLTHGTTFLEHVSIKYVTRFYCISIIYIQPHLIICTSFISIYSLHCF